MRSVRALSTLAAIGTFAVVVVGKLVRVTGASRSIPEWPISFARLTSGMNSLVFLEALHRTLVLVVAVLVVALLVAARRVSKRLTLVVLGSIVLLVATALLGALSIVHPDTAKVVVAGFDQAFAMLFYASIVGLAVWSRTVGA